MGFKWFISWILAFPLFKLLTGVEICGTVPKRGPVIIAGNHTSFLDPPAVGLTTFREVYFLAKPGLFTLSKFFTWLISTYNAFSTGGTKGIKDAIRLLKKENAVVIFPEGTRSKTGALLPFNPGLGHLSIGLDVPVVPVYITNSNKKFISLILRINKLRIKFGRPIFPSGYKKTKEDYKRFSEKIRAEVLNLK